MYEKGYQDVDDIISSVSIKLKGLAVTDLPGIGKEIWDVADYVFPPQVRCTYTLCKVSQFLF